MSDFNHIGRIACEKVSSASVGLGSRNICNQIRYLDANTLLIRWLPGGWKAIHAIV